MEGSARKSIRVWNHAGLGAVVLAVLLASVGLVLAIRQTQAIPLKRIAELRPEAGELAAQINAEVVRQVRETLRNAGVRYATTVPADLPAPPGCPAWMPVVFVYDGRLPPKTIRLGEVAEVAPEVKRRIELLAPRLNLHLEARAPSGGDSNVQFLHEVVGGQPVVVAHLASRHADAPMMIAAILDVERLKREVVRPLLKPYANLELMPAVVKAQSWAEPLAPALPFLTIRPSDTFVSAQHTSAFHRTLVYVGIMLLVLVALLMVMRATVRVAHRELELSRLKSEFVADVSHELKTPLALIQMFGETLLEGRVRSEEKKQEYYEIITRETKRLTHLINNILDFSRIDSGKKIYKMQKVRVERIARDVCEVYRHELDHKGFTHELTVAEGLPEVDADPDAISQALLNLISNSIKYSDEDRWLAVELAHETRRGCRGVLISVRDNGIGIRPEDRAHLFDGFFRAPDDRVRKRRGAGLGLSVVRDIVEAHGGFVEVEARLVKGTTFHIFLPQCREQSEEQSNG